MKKLTLAILLAISFASCKKAVDLPATNTEPYTCASCIAVSEAKAEHDNSSGGVYKGVLAGSTGTYALYVHHNGDEVEAVVTVDGQTTTMHTETRSLWVPGKTIKNTTLQGTLDEKILAAMFSVDSNGMNPVFEIAVPGHNMLATVHKETSTNIVKVYEGNYEGNRKGTFNMSFRGDEVSVITYNKTMVLKGKISGGEIDVMSGDMEIKGTVDGDEASGTWRDLYNNLQGTWSTKRTM